ncbi:MAG: ATP-binding protein [Bacteroidota bacterium]
MSTKRIVITGGPGTGKSVVVKALEAQGFLCYHEVIRDMTASARTTSTEKAQVSNPLVFVDDPLDFNQKILSGRTEHYQESLSENENLIFFDRGIPDVLAYMDFFKQSYPTSFESACKNHRYDAVLIMPPWEAIYVSDNERLESFEEASAIHQHLIQTYRRFGYDPLEVPKISVTQRVAFILKTLS